MCLVEPGLEEQTRLKGMTMQNLKVNKSLKMKTKQSMTSFFFLFPSEETTAGRLLKPAHVKSDTGKELRGLFHNFIAQLKINPFFFLNIYKPFILHTQSKQHFPP